MRNEFIFVIAVDGHQLSTNRMTVFPCSSPGLSLRKNLELLGIIDEPVIRKSWKRKQSTTNQQSNEQNKISKWNFVLSFPINRFLGIKK